MNCLRNVDSYLFLAGWFTGMAVLLAVFGYVLVALALDLLPDEPDSADLSFWKGWRR